MKPTALALACLFFLVACSTGPASAGSKQSKPHSAIGDYDLIEHVAIPQLQRETSVIVHVPSDYHASPGKSYPVLYLLDGQNLFDGATSYSAEWRIDESLQSLRQAGKGDGLIVVGIYNSKYRDSEYVPWDWYDDWEYLKPWFHSARIRGEGQEYTRFIRDSLKPFIDKNYRTKPAACDTGIGGSSLGGCLALYAGLSFPDTFGMVAAFSPAGPGLVDLQVMAEPIEAQRFWENLKPSDTQRIYVDYGAKEFRGPACMACVAPRLAAIGLPPDNLLTYIDPLGVHHETTWARNFPAAVSWLYAW